MSELTVVLADRDEAASLFIDGIGEGRRNEQWLIDRTAERKDAARLVHGRADDREIEPFLAADIAEEDLTEMQAEITAAKVIN